MGDGKLTMVPEFSSEEAQVETTERIHPKNSKNKDQDKIAEDIVSTDNDIEAGSKKVKKMQHAYEGGKDELTYFGINMFNVGIRDAIKVMAKQEGLSIKEVVERLFIKELKRQGVKI